MLDDYLLLYFRVVNHQLHLKHLLFFFSLFSWAVVKSTLLKSIAVCLFCRLNIVILSFVKIKFLSFMMLWTILFSVSLKSLFFYLKTKISSVFLRFSSSSPLLSLFDPIAFWSSRFISAVKFLTALHLATKSVHYSFNTCKVIVNFT